MLPMAIENPIVDEAKRVDCRVLAESVTRFVHDAHR